MNTRVQEEEVIHDLVTNARQLIQALNPHLLLPTLNSYLRLHRSTALRALEC